MKDYKIMFMGTPDIAAVHLKKLIDENFNVVCCVTQPDKPRGRGHKLMPTEVKSVALSYNIPVFQPESLKNEELLPILNSYKPDIILVVAYGKILPEYVLNFPRLGCINVHGSLLPKYRGAAPIQWAVLNGDKQTGITTMYMDIGMDTGDMILKETVNIGEDETTGELWERLSSLGGKLLVDTLKLIEEGKAPREKQGEDFTMAPMLNKEMAEINWEEKSAIEIKNLVRGLNPIMGAFTYINDKKLKLWKVQVISFEEFNSKYNINAEDTELGKVILADTKQGLFLKAKDAVIEVIEIQAEGAKRMNAKDFLRGNQI